MQCKFCQIEITADIRHYRIKSVCMLCFKNRASEYQRNYHKKGKYKHLQAEYKASAERQYLKLGKVKPQELSKEDALFNRLIKKAIYNNHKFAGHIRAETVKNVMERWKMRAVIIENLLEKIVEYFSIEEGHSEDKEFLKLCERIQGKEVNLVFTAGDAFEEIDNNYWLPECCWTIIEEK